MLRNISILLCQDPIILNEVGSIQLVYQRTILSVLPDFSKTQMERCVIFVLW
jgi:hypothetical protein